jgi:nucleotide-binding universal stress UspA family protein
MNQILVVNQTGTTQAPVTAVASAVAAIVPAELRTEVLRPDMDASEATARVLSWLAEPLVVLGVITDGSSSSTLCWQVAQRTLTPIVVVPTNVARPHQPISRVLLPLDGTLESAAAVSPTMDLLARAGVELVVLHVFDASTVPKFWDHEIHAQRVWEDEFLTRHCGHPGVRLELRTGLPGENVIDVAAAAGADLIALGWSRQLASGRALTVRRTVRDARVPVLLVPIVTS